MSNLRLLLGLESFKTFVVGGGGWLWWWVVESDFSVKLWPKPSWTIADKNKEIDELGLVIDDLEKKFAENNIDDKLEAFEKQLIGKIEKALESFSNFMGEAILRLKVRIIIC